MSASDVIKTIKDKEVKYIDLRFTDTRGKEQHVSLPATVISEDFFEEGKMFDGSSIAGWKGINESDMILMPDPTTAVMDPFFDDSTLILRCDIVEPTTMQGYERDPRSIAKRAEEYLKSTGVADNAYFGPEPEFFIFDDVRWAAEMKGAFYEVDSDESSWNSEPPMACPVHGGRPPFAGCGDGRAAGSQSSGLPPSDAWAGSPWRGVRGSGPLIGTRLTRLPNRLAWRAAM